MLFSPPMNPGSQTLGKVDLEDIFSGVVSTELGPSLDPRASSAKTRGFHTQLDEGPETP